MKIIPISPRTAPNIALRHQHPAQRAIARVAAALLLAGVCAQGKVLDTLVVEGLLNPAQSTIIRSQVGIATGADFGATQLQDAIRKLYRLGLYRDLTFAVSSETDSSVSLVLSVTEYPIVESYQFAGNKKLRKDELEKVITIRKNQALSGALIFDNVKALKKLYSEKGYLRAEISCDTIHTSVPGNVIAKLKIKEGSKVRVKNIAFVGNTQIKTSRLHFKFKTKERKFLFGGDFDQERYKQHLDSLIMFYNDDGYIDAEVASDSFWYAPNGKDVYITIKLNEGRKFIAGDVFFSGNKVVETSTLESQVALRKNKPFSKTKFEMTLGAAENAYREEGYLWVQVSDKKEYRGDTVDVTLSIVEGVPAIVRKIDIVGNNKTREKVIRRQIRLMPGQKYKQSLMARSVREVMQLNYFDNVDPQLNPNEDGTVDFVFNVTEKENIGQLSVGAAYSGTDKLMGTFSMSIPNFRGAGQQLDVNVQAGWNSQNVKLGFTEPYAFDSPTLLNGTVFYDHRILQSGKRDPHVGHPRGSDPKDDELTSYGVIGTVGRNLKWPDDYFSASATYEISQQESSYGDSAPGMNIRVPKTGLLSKLSLTLKRNDYDMPMFPSRGTNFYINPQIAGLGGDFKYLKGIVGFDSYTPMFWKFVLGVKTKFGVMAPYRGSIKAQKLDFFGGGGVWNSDVVLRGYPEYSIGGQAYSGGRYHYENGLTMLSLSTEVRFPIVDQTLYMALFGDMGNTWERVADIDVRNMYTGAGVGFRLMVPMLGLIGFDFGWPFDKLHKDRHFGNNIGSRGQFHFIMNRGF